MTHDFYCDESGNSGGNYLDAQQPFYVLAGWLIEKEKRFKIDNLINKYIRAHFPEKNELKGSEILKSVNGQKIINNLFTEAGQLGCVPFFVIAEKKYCIAAKIVEAFLDYAHNENIMPELSWMNGVKKSIAEIIYHDCPQSLLNFANAHNNPCIESIKIAHDSLISELNNNSHFELANAISGSSKFLEDILWEETHTMTAMPHKAMHSLNLPIFISFIQILEKFSRKVNINKLRFYHDQTKQFEEAYPEAFNWYRNGEATFVLETGTEIVFGFTKIKILKMVDSIETPMIQLADLLASFINLFVTRVYLEKNISPETLKFGKIVVGGLLGSINEHKLIFNDTVMSEDFLSKILNSVGLNVSTPRPLKETGINKFLKL
ncbi:DUF3800 domain-containing protein [Paenibacillus sacheonensis]|uniref:DUF3800 domain-containing protein n=1 Tax=Paenibacillus sacheonensis TaxID=742054 RepID=A0A7X4YP53_9BACL|nr:DUF3800 domain-containing protein [Paenibacillus sacheonensis]MBM7565261.1 hypothetical protein [Paenibacillus sacheonensis]NBC69965.1 DUF3800 domain-containing protein [Paenibacillus sacheonensis]